MGKGHPFMNQRMRLTVLWVVAALVLAGVAALVLPRTDLYGAAAKGDLARVRALVEKTGAKINEPSQKGRTPLELAIEGGRKEVAGWLLAHGADVKRKNKEGQTPLHLAIGCGDDDVVKMLLDKGADPNARSGNDEHGETPLVAAVQHGNRAVLRMLLEHGADPELAAYGGARPLDYAKEADDQEAIGILKGFAEKKQGAQAMPQ